MNLERSHSSQSKVWNAIAAHPVTTKQDKIIMPQNLALLNYGEIRVTPDARYSVFDVVEVIGGKKNPRQAWKLVCESFPEVVQKVDNFQFSGAGQRLTPVTNKEGLLYIIGLLPGAVGQTYREDAAKLMLSKVEGRSEEVATFSDNLALLPAPKEIAEAIASVFCMGTVDPNLVQGLIANEIGNAYPALKPHMEAAKKLLPLPVEQELLTVTDLAKKYVAETGNPLSKNNTERGNAIALNKLLISLGLQVQNPDGNPSYLPTELGKPYSQLVLQEGKESNKTCQQLRWYPKVIERLA
jgi:hypothetical protein